jgi:hypothetical protein
MIVINARLSKKAALLDRALLLARKQHTRVLRKKHIKHSNIQIRELVYKYFSSSFPRHPLVQRIV